jgi:hypothetical protein
MVVKRLLTWFLAASLWAAISAANGAYGNAGPFLVKYPNGDPAAKGVLARLDPTLRPTREARLRVVQEDLDIVFVQDRSFSRDSQPLAAVTATYSIENPTAEEVEIDFGFPILRGIYMSPFSMMPRPDAQVMLIGKPVETNIISNSVIYGIIREQAWCIIDDGLAADAQLAKLVAAVRKASGIAPPSDLKLPQQLAVPATPPNAEPKLPQPTADYSSARSALRDYLVSRKRWNERDAALLVEYACLDFRVMRTYPRDRWLHGVLPFFKENVSAKELLYNNMGPLAAIGEQKATQFFAQLASQFDKKAASTYEEIFSAWGGDVRERSIDLDSGQIRPREIDAKESEKRVEGYGADPTVFARIDYLDPHAKLSETEKESCKAVLKNLPVTFTFAPMNLLHYQVKFPAKETRTVTVTYKQYAYLDTRGTPSYQLAYVLHPASFWNDFGPVQLSVQAPKGVACRASLPFSKTEELQPDAAISAYFRLFLPMPKYTVMKYQARLEKNQEKTGEIFIGIDKAAWDELVKKEEKRIKEEQEKQIMDEAKAKK